MWPSVESNLGIALTHFNRYDFLRDSIRMVLADPRVAEVVISDDASDDGSYEQLQEYYKGVPKVRLFQNEMNIDSYENKAKAVEHATTPWVILLDSDNVLPVAYLDAVFAVAPWEPRCTYLPVFAEPEFDYRAFAGRVISRENVGAFMDQTLFATALNTGNYVVNREEYLKVWDGSVVPYTSEPIYQNYRWLEAGNVLMFVPSMQYYHRIHNGSHFKQNSHRTGMFAHRLEASLRQMR